MLHAKQGEPAFSVNKRDLQDQRGNQSSCHPKMEREKKARWALRKGANVSSGTEVCIIQKVCMSGLMRPSRTFHWYWYTTHADFYSPRRLSLPSNQNPGRDLIPAKHNFSLYVFALECWSKVSDPCIFSPIHIYSLCLDCKWPVVPALVRWWHCYPKFNGVDPPVLCSTRKFKKEERVGIMWTHTRACTHIFPWEPEINRNVWFPQHSRPDAPSRGGGACTLTRLHTANKDNPYK